MIKFISHYKKSLLFISVASIAALQLFYGLGDMPVQLWDESRQAINVLEMMQNGNFLVTHFDGQPDTWSTKPPLLIWIQYISCQLFGYNSFGLRFPSAVAGLMTVLAILSLVRFDSKSVIPSAIAALSLVSYYHFVDVHGTRTGDFDALLTLFTTLMVIGAVNFIDSNNKKWLYLLFGAMTMAVMTKGVAGLLFMPGIVILFMAKSNRSDYAPHVFLGLLFFVVIIGGYYLIRENVQPGYLGLVWNNEIGGRYSNSIESHDQPFWHYFFFLFDRQAIMTLLGISGIAIGLLDRHIRTKNWSLGLALIGISFLLIISISQTKLDWYLLPIYPLLAIGVGLLTQRLFQKRSKWSLIGLCVLVLVILVHTSVVFAKNMKVGDARYAVGREALKHLIIGESSNPTMDLASTPILVTGYAPDIWTQISISEKGGRKIFGVKLISDIRSNDELILYDEKQILILKEDYDLTFLNEVSGLFFVQIKKPESQ